MALDKDVVEEIREAGYWAGRDGVQINDAYAAEDEAICEVLRDRRVALLDSDDDRQVALGLDADDYHLARAAWIDGNDEGRAIWLASDEIVSVSICDDAEHDMYVSWREADNLADDEWTDACDRVDEIVRRHGGRVAAAWARACEAGVAPSVDVDIDGDRMISLERYVDE